MAVTINVPWSEYDVKIDGQPYTGLSDQTVQNSVDTGIAMFITRRQRFSKGSGSTLTLEIHEGDVVGSFTGIDDDRDISLDPSRGQDKGTVVCGSDVNEHKAVVPVKLVQTDDGYDIVATGDVGITDSSSGTMCFATATYSCTVSAKAVDPARFR